jgi:hypothetical protein
LLTWRLSDAFGIFLGFALNLAVLNILWWGSMVTPVGTTDFGAIVLPVPMPLLYLGSLSTILRNQAFYRRRRRIFASVDGWIDREGEQDLWIDGRRQDERSL